MKKTFTLCALLGTLIIGTGAKAFSQNQEINNSKTRPRNYEFKSVQYAINQGDSISSSELGKLMQTDMQIQNVDGESKVKTMQFYDYDGDSIPDIILFKKDDKQSIGVDYGSKNFKEIREILGDRVTLFDPYK